MGIGIGQLILILVVVLLIFGAGKVPNMMRDLARGIRAFKDGLAEGDAPSQDASANEDAQQVLPPAPNKKSGEGA